MAESEVSAPAAEPPLPSDGSSERSGGADGAGVGAGGDGGFGRPSRFKPFPPDAMTKYTLAFEGVVGLLWERVERLEARAEDAERRQRLAEKNLANATGANVRGRIEALEARVMNLAHNIEGFSRKTDDNGRSVPTHERTIASAERAMSVHSDDTRSVGSRPGSAHSRPGSAPRTRPGSAPRVRGDSRGADDTAVPIQEDDGDNGDGAGGETKAKARAAAAGAGAGAEPLGPAYDGPGALGSAGMGSGGAAAGATRAVKDEFEDAPELRRKGSRRMRVRGATASQIAAAGGDRRATLDPTGYKPTDVPGAGEERDYRELWRKVFRHVKMANRMNKHSMLDMRGVAENSLMQRIKNLEQARTEQKYQIERVGKQLQLLHNALEQEVGGAPGTAKHLVTLMISMLGATDMAEGAQVEEDAAKAAKRAAAKAAAKGKQTANVGGSGKADASGGESESKAGAGDAADSTAAAPHPDDPPPADTSKFPLEASMRLFLEDREDLVLVLDDFLAAMVRKGANPHDAGSSFVSKIAATASALRDQLAAANTQLLAKAKKAGAGGAPLTLTSGFLVAPDSRVLFERLLDYLDAAGRLYDGEVVFDSTNRRRRTPPLKFQMPCAEAKTNLSRFWSGLSAHQLSVVAAQRLNGINATARAGGDLAGPFRRARAELDSMGDLLEEANAAMAAARTGMDALTSQVADLDENVKRMLGNEHNIERALIDFARMKQTVEEVYSTMSRLERTVQALQESSLPKNEVDAIRAAHKAMQEEMEKALKALKMKADKKETSSAIKLVTDAVTGLEEERAPLRKSVTSLEERVPLKVDHDEMDRVVRELKGVMQKLARRVGKHAHTRVDDDAAMISRIRPRCLSCNRPLRNDTMESPAHPPGFSEDDQNAFRPQSPPRARSRSPDAILRHQAATSRPPSAPAHRLGGTTGGSTGRFSRPKSAAARSQHQSPGPGPTASETFAQMDMTVPLSASESMASTLGPSFPARALGSGPRHLPNATSAPSVPIPHGELMVMRHSTSGDLALAERSLSPQDLGHSASTTAAPGSPEADERPPQPTPTAAAAAHKAPRQLSPLHGGGSGSGLDLDSADSPMRASKHPIRPHPRAGKVTKGPSHMPTHAIPADFGGQVHHPEDWTHMQGPAGATPHKRPATVSSYQRMMPGKKMSAAR